ncbi:MAG TPA: CCA tRNA nucleotidyltransferase, partial [Spirochaetes bacterium]|nr:CCA tRNA nucleotidyltransferase [Spirochaetota bacterium]
KDGTYQDGRHPENVLFTNEKEDVMRRDFTINGILYDPMNDEIIDYVDGQKDIQDKVIRAIGDPIQRFEEDKLRMLRAIRFSARLSYTIEPGTWKAIQTYYTNINEVSVERIRDELAKILTEGQASVGIRLLDQSGLLNMILPEVSQLKNIERVDGSPGDGSLGKVDMFCHTLLLLDHMTKPSKELALAVLLKHVDWNLARSICGRLKLSNKEKSHVLSLVQQQSIFNTLPQMRESELKRFLRQEHFKDHLEYHRLEALASHGKLDIYDFCVHKLAEYWSKHGNLLHPKKILNGNMLIKLGFKAGSSFKSMLVEVENLQLEGVLSTEEEAIEYVKTHFAHLLNDNP